MKLLDTLGIESADINGVPCIRVADYAKITNKTSSHIGNLIKYGNSVRKLKVERFMGSPFVPISEITDYPFTTVGRNCQVYHYLEDGTTSHIPPKEA